MPRKEMPNHSLIHGFEINLTPDRKIEDCYFVTRCAFTLDELEQNNYNIFKKIFQVKMTRKMVRTHQFAINEIITFSIFKLICYKKYLKQQLFYFNKSTSMNSFLLRRY